MTEQIVPIFRVTDAAAALAWYERLGFECEIGLTDPDGNRLRIGQPVEGRS